MGAVRCWKGWVSDGCSTMGEGFPFVFLKEVCLSYSNLLVTVGQQPKHDHYITTT